MRILFLVARPTQFEAPFFRFAAADPAHELKPLFWDTQAAAPVEDSELGRRVDWGFDVLAGYPHAVAPASGGTAWIEDELAKGCDLLIVNGYTLPLCRSAAKLARRRGIRTALRLDSVCFPGEAGPSLIRRLFVRHVLGRRFDIFLGTSSLTLRYLRHCGISASRSGLFPYAVDHEHFRAASAAASASREKVREGWGVPRGAKAVLAIAKLHSRETPWDLLRAMATLPPDIHLVIAGDGPERPAVESFVAATAPDRIHLLGYANYADLPRLYAAADLFVHAPQEERWGVSVAEALACGLPAVAGRRVGAAHDLLTIGGNGYVYNTGDAMDLAQKVRQALALPTGTVAAASSASLAKWDYAASWRSLLAAAS